VEAAGEAAGAMVVEMRVLAAAAEKTEAMAA
jgi:hypothetical protein